MSLFVVCRACLQISDGAFPAARAALEEFLAVQSTCLPEEKYADVVELFVIKVLVKGLQEIESAINWVERANLTEEARLVGPFAQSLCSIIIFSLRSNALDNWSRGKGQVGYWT